MRDPQGEINRRTADALRRGALPYPMPGAVPLPGAAAEPSAGEYGAAWVGGEVTLEPPSSPTISGVQQLEAANVGIALGGGMKGVDLDSDEPQSASQPGDDLGLCEPVEGLAATVVAGVTERPLKGRKEKKEKKERHREREAARTEGTGRAAGQGSGPGEAASQLVGLSEAPASRPASAGGPHKIRLKLRTRGPALP